MIERLATEGSYVSTGTPLYRVANLRTLWVQLDAYESDLAQLSVGQKVQISVEALPGEEVEGEVTFVDPTLDARRRTARVRVQVDNADGRLRPGMFVQASVATPTEPDAASPLVVPATAPLFTGRRAIVYVERPADGRTEYEPRTVRLGPRLGQFYSVVAGLAEGERVVTRGAFALDADLQIRGGPSMMNSSDDRDVGGWDRLVELNPAQRDRLAPVVSAYLAMQVALADDALPPAKTAASELIDAVAAVDLSDSRAAAEAWTSVAGTLRTAAARVASSDNLEGARLGFEPLSGAVRELLHRFGNPLEHPLRLAFCPMAAGSRGASWIQQGEEIDNAYFGAAMLTCGEVREEIAPGDHLPGAHLAGSHSAAAGGAPSGVQTP